jgi:O-antigen/teichoic acid export membrane protein
LLIFSVDIILAKVFFKATPEVVGEYAVLSMLGKMIFFGTMAIGKAMFPITSEKHDNSEDTFSVFKKSFLIIIFLCIIAIGVFFFIPDIVLFFSYGSKYLVIANYLVYSAIAFSFLSLTNLIILYKLSKDQLNTKRSYFLVIFLLIEIVLLALFHNSILEYILAFMVSNIVMFIGTLFFLKINEEVKSNNTSIQRRKEDI